MKLNISPIRRQYQIRLLSQVEPLAAELARYFPNPCVHSGIHELLVNAIEHGNLGIGFDEKTLLLKKGVWQQEVERRQLLPEYKNREVWIMLDRTAQGCSLVITDDGQGFDWRPYMRDCPPDKLPNGRGLRIANNCGFSELRFNERGNQATCLVYG